MIKHLILLKIQFKIDIKEVLYQSFMNFFDQKSSGSDFRSKIMSNQELAEELHKPIISKFQKRKVYSSFKVNILGC